MKISKVYTKTGDKGTTSLVGGVRVLKTDERIEAYGTADELNSHLGLLASLMDEGADKQMIENIQNKLFVVSSYLATDQSKTDLSTYSIVTEKDVILIEKEIDKILEIIPPQTNFILPGGTYKASIAHVCRTICRRTERRILSLTGEVQIDSNILAFINRLSDYLYVLARKLNFIEGKDEKIWKKSCE